LPSSGILAGGTVITVSGANFQNNAKVWIGGVRATVSSVTPTTITATTRAGTSAGTVDVIVINPDAQGVIFPGGFTYLAVPQGPSVKAYPNPVRPSKGLMTFTGLKAGTTVKIYTLEGSSVRDLPVDPDGLARWDAKDADGKDVGSGVYLARVEGLSGKKTVKVAVQR
jgi:hypothetical protein